MKSSFARWSFKAIFFKVIHTLILIGIFALYVVGIGTSLFGTSAEVDWLYTAKIHFGFGIVFSFYVFLLRGL